MSGWTPIIGLLGVVVGGVLTAWLTDRREDKKRHTEFVKLQLSQFYGPMLGLRAEILARGQLRVKLGQAIEVVNTRDMEEMGQYIQNYVADTMQNNRKRSLGMAREEDLIFREKSMPAYRKMLDVFRDNMWLAEPETRSYLGQFLEFLDIWERHLMGTMPDEVVWEISHTEENLHPFYRHLEQTHDRLRAWLAREVEPVPAVLRGALSRALAALKQG